MDLDQQFRDQALTEIEDLVRTEFNDARDAAREDAAEVLRQSEDRLKIWLEQLARGEIDDGEFRWLVEAQSDVVRIVALKHAGMTEERAQRLIIATLEIAVRVGIEVAKRLG